MSGSGRDALPNVQEWSGCPPGFQGVVGRPYWMSGSGREAFAVVWEWSVGPQEGREVVGRPSRMSESGRETFRVSGSGQESLPDVRE